MVKRSLIVRMPRVMGVAVALATALGVAIAARAGAAARSSYATHNLVSDQAGIDDEAHGLFGTITAG